MSDDKKHKTTCPNCGVDIDVNTLLYQQLDRELRQQYQQQISEAEKEFATQQQILQTQQLALKNEQQQLENTVKSQVAATLQAEKSVLQQQLKQQISQQLEQEQSERIKSIEDELAQKTQKVIELNKAQAEIARLKREQQALRTEIELDIEKKYTAQLAAQTDKLMQQINSEVELKIAEKEQVINQLKNQLSDAQRKAEQGSSQLQGEVQELAIEQWLRGQFPFDDIQEIKKGAQGGDTLQLIFSRDGLSCGSIYYESKRTKAFQPAWIDKFKQDIQQKNASVGVLVTQVMPDGMNNLGQIDGVWVCTFDEFKNLSRVLRESLVQLAQALVTQENKGDKMNMLYDYLTGNEFRMQIEAIVDGFTQLKSDLLAEQRAMQSIWKKREKQIDRVLLNTNYMYSSVKGIAGNAIQHIKHLELDDSSE